MMEKRVVLKMVHSRLAGIFALVLAGVVSGPAAAGEYDALLGTWTLKGTPFKIAVAPCENTICGTIVEGPKNIGLKMMGELKFESDKFRGKIVNPDNRETYYAQVEIVDADTVSISGCTAKGVCAKRTMKRVR